MARKKVKQRSASAENDGSESTASVPAVHSGRTLRGKRGGLKDMPNMPLDILNEIISYLHPQDLLHLARTSKDFRAFLMRRDSAFLWKAARHNIEGFPDCPTYLSEPAYANLAFSNHCHRCLKRNVKAIIWEFSARYCSSCKKNMFIVDVFRTFDRDFYHAMLVREVECEVLMSIAKSQHHSYYHKPEVDLFLRSWSEVGDDEDARDAFFEKQCAATAEVEAHAHLCRMWMDDRANSRARELEDIRRQRFEAIVERLRDMGWATEVDRAVKYYRFKNHVHMRVAKPLTEREWQKIRPDMIAEMEDWKKQLEIIDREEVLLNRFSTLTDFISDYNSVLPRTANVECMPHFMDYALMPEIREIIDVPNDVNVTEESFNAIRDQFPGLISRWFSEAGRQLELMLSDVMDISGHPDPLGLAVAFFQCKACRKLMTYPHVLAHQCIEYSCLAYQTHLKEDDFYVQKARQSHHSIRWTANGYRVADSFERIARLIRLCGKDPKTATRNEMRDLDPRFCFASHFRQPGRRVAMDWRTAIDTETASFIFVDEEEDHFRPRLASAGEEAKVKEVEATTAHISRVEYEDQENWCCAYCTDFEFRFESMHTLWEHVRDAHGKDDPSEENGDFYLHPDGDVLSPLPVGLTTQAQGDSIAIGIPPILAGHITYCPLPEDSI